MNGLTRVLVPACLLGTVLTGCASKADQITAGQSPVTTAGSAASDQIAKEKQATEDAGLAVHTSDLTVQEVPVTQHMVVFEGRSALDPAPGVKPSVTAQQMLDAFTKQSPLPSNAKGKSVEAMFGLYTDTAYGEEPSNGAFKATLTKRPAWVLRIKDVLVVRSGPAPVNGQTSPSEAANSGQITTVFDAETGQPFFTVEEGN